MNGRPLRVSDGVVRRPGFSGGVCRCHGRLGPGNRLLQAVQTERPAGVWKALYDSSCVMDAVDPGPPNDLEEPTGLPMDLAWC